MTLTVVSRAQYLTAPVGQMRPADYDAIHLVHAVKGHDLNPRQWSSVTIDGIRLSIKQSNKDRAIDWFAEWCAGLLNASALQQIVLIPIPSSRAVVDSPPDFRTAIIANAIANRCAGRAATAPILRFQRQLPSASSEGGSRDPQVLYPEMRLIAPVPDGTIILIDDVKTSGGHLIAASWKLADVEKEARAAFCCGSTSHDQLADPFNVPLEELDITRP